MPYAILGSPMTRSTRKKSPSLGGDATIWQVVRTERRGQGCKRSARTLTLTQISSCRRGKIPAGRLRGRRERRGCQWLPVQPLRAQLGVALTAAEHKGERRREVPEEVRFSHYASCVHFMIELCVHLGCLP